MSSQDIDKAFVSTYDKFLYEFDRDHEKSASQIAEILKHQRIAYLRDNPNPVAPSEEIWQDF